MNVTIEDEYLKLFPILENLAEAIKLELENICAKLQHIDMVKVRVKSPHKFMQKVDNKNYRHPFKDMQDQIGARIVVFFLPDVEIIREAIKEKFVIAEDKFHEPLLPNQFDYEGHHMICSIPPNLREKFGASTEVFELQISTLFQHAWAEANHDLGYKPDDPTLDLEIKRKIAWAAAQAWGADKIFEEIFANKQKITLLK